MAQGRHANAFHFTSRECFEAEVAQLNGKLKHDHRNADEIYVGIKIQDTPIAAAHELLLALTPADETHQQ